MKKSQKKILIVNPFGIGDVVFSTSVIANVRIAYPDSFVGYLCNVRTAPILENDPKINKVFIYEKDDWRKLWKKGKFKCIIDFLKFLLDVKSHKFDIAIDLSLGRHYSFFLWLLGVRKRYGFNYRNRGIFLTNKIDIEGYQNKHVIEHYLDLLRFMDLEPKQIKPKVYLSDESKRWADDFLKAKGIDKTQNVVGIVPGGGASWGKGVDIRRWSKEKFAQLADIVIDRTHANVIIFGDALESKLCKDVVSLMKNNPIQVIGQTNLIEFISILSRCAIVIANDGGPLHLSVAVGVKTISLFGPVDDRVYGQYPYDSDMHRIMKVDLPCRPCYDKFKMPPCKHDKKCLNDISVDEVLAVVYKLSAVQSVKVAK